VDEELRNLTRETVNVQKELRNATQKMRELTESSVDDSAAVRIITLLSAFYLPGSFAAVSRMPVYLVSKALTVSVFVWDELLRFQQHLDAHNGGS
jgi:hypothetical protein